MVEILGFEIFRYERGAGQELVIGLSWELLVLFTFIAFLTFLAHFVVRDLLRPADHSNPGDSDPPVDEVQSNLQTQGIEHVERFSATQRVSHWVMAIAVFLLMLSGFILMNPDLTVQPPLGISWVDIHIIFSIVFIAYVIFHIGHVAYKGTWMAMWIGVTEIKDIWARGMHLIGQREGYPRQLKYPSAQKFLHLGVTVASIGVILSGLVMIRRIEVPFLWDATREFSFLGITFNQGISEAGWGLVTWSFVLHDLFAILMVGLVLGHVYFALRPEEWGITKSMFTGSVSADTYAKKYSPTSWNIGAVAQADGGDDTVTGEEPIDEPAADE